MVEIVNERDIFMAKKERSALAARIVELRRAGGMTQEEAARALNVHRTSYTKYETDAAMPDVECLANMARLFGVTADYLLGLDERTGHDMQRVGLTEEEVHLVVRFRRLAKRKRQALLEEIEEK